MRKTSQEITDLENIEEQQSGIISALEIEVEEVKKKMETVKEDILQRKKKMEEGKHSLQEAEHKLAAIKDKIHQVEEEAGPVKDGLSQADDMLENSKNHLRHYEEKKKEHLESMKRLKNHLDAKEKELMEVIAKASEIHPERIEGNRTVKSLDTEMNRLREEINSERERTGDREEIIRQFQEAKEKYHSAEGEVKNLKKFIKLLDEVMDERYKTFISFRRFLTMRCKYYFNSLLSQRSFSGKIEFNHKNEKLSITVQPGEGNKAALDDMKSLSGGERSFSTVCFILSLWSIAESPFRCLDEFDVFMDMINRRIAMDMMLKMADSQRYRQFILLTPQHMSSLPTSRFIRILRMQDPERGQNTLNFRPRGEEDEDEE
ncbi:UNVERIFIED_CONTAM: Structural maintenance of chromosomes protein 6 [Gekko kuhli]